MLRIIDVSHAYGTVPALSSISFDVHQGAMGVIGPNGSGKSTLLNIIAGAMKPQKGAIWWGGANLTTLPPHRIACRGISRMSQHSHISGDLTVSENISLGIYGFHGGLRLRWPPTTASLVREAAALCGIDSGRLTAYPRQLSFFEQRMTELARCIVSASTQLLLLDEPTAGFADLEKKRVFSILSTLKTKMTILLVEHDLDFIQEVSDCLAVMAEGKLLSIGEPAFVLKEPRVLDTYLGTKYVAG